MHVTTRTQRIGASQPRVAVVPFREHLAMSGEFLIVKIRRCSLQVESRSQGSWILLNSLVHKTALHIKELFGTKCSDEDEKP